MRYCTRKIHFLYTKETDQFRIEIVDLRVDLSAHGEISVDLSKIAFDILGQLTAPSCAQQWVLQA